MKTYPVYHVRGALCDGSAAGAFPRRDEEARVTMADVFFGNSNMDEDAKLWFFLKNCSEREEDEFIVVLGMWDEDAAWNAEAAYEILRKERLDTVRGATILCEDVRNSAMEQAERAATHQALLAAMVIVARECDDALPAEVRETLLSRRASRNADTVGG